MLLFSPIELFQCYKYFLNSLETCKMTLSRSFFFYLRSLLLYSVKKMCRYTMCLYFNSDVLSPRRHLDYDRCCGKRYFFPPTLVNFPLSCRAHHTTLGFCHLEVWLLLCPLPWLTAEEPWNTQLVQNVTACLFSNASHTEHIIPMLCA